MLPASRESGDKGLAGPEISLNLCAVNAVGVNWWIWERRTALAVQSCIRVQCVLLTERAGMRDNFPICLEGERLTFMTEYLSLEFLPNNIQMRLVEQVGSSWDGASIPRYMRWIIGHPLSPELRQASYWHDRICEGSETFEDRMVADSIFLMLLRRSGVVRWRRWAMWFAVRFYAMFVWRISQWVRRRKAISVSGASTL